MEPILDQLRQEVAIAIEISPERLALIGDSPQELFDIMARHEFRPYRIINDYSPTSYPRAIRNPAPPVRLREPVQDETDVIFSHLDVEVLT